MTKLADVFQRVPNAFLEDSELVKIDIYKDDRAIDVVGTFGEIVPHHEVAHIEKTIGEAYRLRRVRLHPRYSLTLLTQETFPLIVPYLDMPQGAPVLSGARISVGDGCLDVETAMACVDEPQLTEALSNTIQTLFGAQLTVRLRQGKSEDQLMEEYQKAKDELAAQLEEPAVKKEQKKSSSPVIYGREIRGVPVPIGDVTELSGRVIVDGELFTKDVTTKETRDGRFIVLFDITDNQNSITCKLFLQDKKIYQAVTSRLKKGVAVCVRGLAQYDKYARDLLISVDDLMEIEKEERMDEAETKRVELHLHTQMSSMDSLVNIDEVLQRAAKWGHKAIAITDHGVVQAFPFAMTALDYKLKNSGLKVLYGVEAYLVDIGRPIVFGSAQQGIAQDVVVFDIETTGLSAQKDRITEIGAVKIKDGQIVDRFSTFVNPGIPIPPKIAALTSITDSMVADSDPIETVLPKFMEFCGDAVLVAHNAGFDVGFIREALRRQEQEFTATYIDTVELARALLPDLPKHKLDVVAKHLNISLEGHHRAVNDAEATAQIYLEFAKRLEAMEVSTVQDINIAFDEEKDVKKKHYSHAVIFAKTPQGLKNLYKIVSESHLNYFYKRPRVSKALYYKYCEGLMMGSACEQGELYRALLAGKDRKEIARIARLYDYFEIQPLGNNDFMIRSGKVRGKEDLIAINKRIVELGDYYHKPVVATCDVHFLDPHHAQYRAVLQAGQGYSDADNQAPLFFRTTEEMLAEFSYLGEQKAYEVVVENTNKIADLCETLLPVPRGTFPPIMENAPEEIQEMSLAKAKRIYGEELPKVVKDRMDKELHSIITYGFSVMYLIAQRLVTKSNKDGYLVGSRGSVGSSFIAFLSDITEVNALPPHYVCPNCKHSEFIEDGSVACGVDMPDKSCPACGTNMNKDGHDIPFETFLGFAGDKEPDIDLNFSGDYQPVAHKYTEELFGEGHVFRAGTIGTLAERTAYGFVKKYLDERNKTVSNAEINRLVAGCTGVKRTTGQHPGGVMILPKGHDIHEFCPIQRPADDNTKDIITTHFDYHSISGRLLKLDILGHDDPTMIRMLEDLTGVDAKTIPLDDQETMSLFKGTQALGVTPEDIDSKVGTFGVPEFGTKFVRQMLLDTEPTTFAELVRISGLSHGTDVWLNNAQELVRSNTATLKEVICTRDDIMLYLLYRGVPAKSAFDIMEHVRKGKGLNDEEITIMRANNIPEWYIQSCQKIKYMFPKAHAVAYVTMAFRIAWFKVHYPKAFYIAHFTVRADEFDAELMCDEATAKRTKKELEAKLESLGKSANAKEKNVLTILEIVCEMYARGIKFLPIDLYKSDATKFLDTPGGILPPLSALAGLGNNAAISIVNARNECKFCSIEDLRIRGKVSKTIIELMRAQGCLEGMDESSQMTFF